MQPDPIGLNSANLRRPQTLNRYSYVQNDPVNFVDPSGTNAVFFDCVTFRIVVNDRWENITSCNSTGEWDDDAGNRGGYGNSKGGGLSVQQPSLVDKLLDLARKLANVPAAQRNDCLALVEMIKSLADPENSVIDAVNSLGIVLAGGDVVSQVLQRLNNQNYQAMVEFGNNGFREEFRDTVSPNQVRHFIGALMAGAVLGAKRGLEKMNGREQPGSLDTNLNNVAVPLGAALQEHNSKYGNMSTVHHQERMNKLADEVRDKICAPNS